LFKTVFTISHKDFLKILKEKIPDFKEPQFNAIKNEIRNDPNCFKYKYLDTIPTSKSVKKPWYSNAGVEKAIRLLTNPAK